jgi:hypothetical protein
MMIVLIAIGHTLTTIKEGYKPMIKKIKTNGKGKKMIAYYIRVGFKIASYNHNVFTLTRGI